MPSLLFEAESRSFVAQPGSRVVL